MHPSTPRPRDTGCVTEQRNGPRVLAWGVLLLGAWCLAVLTAWFWP